MKTDRHRPWDMNAEEAPFRWPDRFTHCEQDYDHLLEDIRWEDEMWRRWNLHCSDMGRWFAEEQARCAMPTVADVAEHWSYNDLNS